MIYKNKNRVFSCTQYRKWHVAQSDIVVHRMDDFLYIWACLLSQKVIIMFEAMSFNLLWVNLSPALSFFERLGCCNKTRWRKKKQNDMIFSVVYCDWEPQMNLFTSERSWGLSRKVNQLNLKFIDLFFWLGFLGKGCVDNGESMSAALQLIFVKASKFISSKAGKAQ